MKYIENKFNELVEFVDLLKKRRKTIFLIDPFN